MKKFIFAAVIIFLTLFVYSQTILDKDTVLNIRNLGQIELKKGYKVEFDSGGVIIKVYIPEPIEVNKDLTLAPEQELELYPNGAVKRFVPFYPLKFTIKYAKITAPANKPIEFYPSGKVKKIYSTTDFDFVTAKGDTITIEGGTPVTFYENQELKIGLPKYPTDIHVNNTVITLRPHRPIKLYPDGSLWAGFLHLKARLKDSLGNTVELDTGRYVEFNKFGKLIRH